MSAKETAEYIGVETDTLAKWRSRGVGPPYSAALGRDPRYRRSDLERFMLSGLVENAVQARAFRKRARLAQGASTSLG